MLTGTARRHVPLLPSLLVWAAVLLLCFSAVAAQAAPVTLTFNSSSGLGDGVANAGDGGSVTVPGKDIRITVAADSNGAPAGSIGFQDAWGGLTYDDGANGSAMGFVIRSGNGAAFRFTSLNYLNWGDSQPTIYEVSGFRSGVRVASTTFDSVDPGFQVRAFTAPAGFDNVDEVRLIHVGGGAQSSGNGSWLAINTITLDDPPASAPTVQSVTSPQTGDVAINQNVAVRVQFSEPVTVTGGTPTLLLETGTTDRLAIYASGSGTNTLQFNYLVQSGDFSSRLNYFSTGSLSLAGATVRSAAGTDASLVLPALNSPNSLASANISVDGRPPAVVRVQAISPSISYRAGTTVDMWVVFDKSVRVMGTPVLHLATGGSDNTAAYRGGDYTNQLIFQYTVKAGDTAADLDYVSTAALELAGGMILGVAGNQTALLQLPAPGGPGSLASSANIVLDTTPPSVVSAAWVGSPNAQATTLTYQIQFNEELSRLTPAAIAVGGTGTAAAEVGDATFGTSSVTVELRNVRGSGELYLTLLSDLVRDVARNEFVGPYEVSPRHVVAEATAPGAPLIGTATASEKQATVTFSPPASNGNSPILDYTVTASPGGNTASGAGSPLVVTGLTDGISYTFQVTARNAIGTSPASGASNAVVPRQRQSVTFNAPGNQSFGTTPTLVASASSGLPIAWLSGTPAVCAVNTGGVLDMLAAGDCTITARQAGDAFYEPATDVTHTFAVLPVAPSAPLNVAASDAGPGRMQVSFSAPAQNGGEAVVDYTVTAQPGGAQVTASVSPVLFSGLTNGTQYSFTVTARNSAGRSPASAPSTPAAPMATQTITFDSPGAQDFGSTPTLSARSDSGLPVSFTSITPAVCAIGAGNVLQFNSVGTCSVRADQAGNATYLPAAPVTRDMAVNAVVPGIPVVRSATALGATAARVGFSAPAFTGGLPITGYVVTAQPGGITTSGASSPIDVAGLTTGQRYTFTVAAVTAAGTGTGSPPSNPVQLLPAVTINDVSVSLPYGAAATPVPLSINGTPRAAQVATPPQHGTAVASGTGITYQPAAGFAGTDTFTYTASDDWITTAPATVTITVAPPTLAVEDPEPGTYGVAYRRSLRAVGGTAPYTFRLTGGALPTGVQLGSDGMLEGMPEQAGEHAADIEVRDANGFTLVHALRWTVAKAETAIEGLAVASGEPVFTPAARLELAATSSGSTQPIVFSSSTPSVCEVTGSTVLLLAVGRCSITATQAGDANHADAPAVTLDIDIAAATPDLTWVGDLHKVFGEGSFDLPQPQSNSPGAFTYDSSDPAVASLAGRTVTLHGDGETLITARQAAAGSFSATTVSLRLRVQVRPDPTRDAAVVGLLQAQVDASVRFAVAQQANIRDRLRQVRAGSNASSNTLSMAYQGERGAGLSVPVSSVAASGPALPEGWGSWVAGSASWGRGGALKSTRYDLQTDGVTVGVDHALGDTVLLGVAGSMGRNRSELDDHQTRMHADQRSLAVYGVWRMGQGLFVDALIANGQLDFNLRRWSSDAQDLARAERDGDQWFGSLAFGYDHQGDALTLTGYGRVDSSRTELDGYAEQGAGVFALVYRPQRVRSTAVALGMEGSFQATESRLRPFWSVEYRQALQDKGDAELNYAQWGAPQDYRVRMQSYNDNALMLAAGLDIEVSRSWMLSLLLGHEQARGSDSSRTVGLRLSWGKPGNGAAGVSTSEDGNEAVVPAGQPRCPPRGCPAR